MINVNRDLHMLIKLMENTGEGGIDLLRYIILGACDIAIEAQKSDDLVAEFRAQRVINESMILHNKFSEKE